MEKIDNNKKETTEQETIIDKPVIKEEPEPVSTKPIYHSSTSFNSVLSFCNRYLKYVDIRKLWVYQVMHSLFILILGFIILFDSNLVHLMIALIIVSLDAISVVILQECPLSLLERKYTGTCMCDTRYENLMKSGIAYGCNHEYEKQIELLINVWILISGKCLMIVLFNLINVKLVNYNNLYL